jgi:hypothetical protein
MTFAFRIQAKFHEGPPYWASQVVDTDSEVVPLEVGTLLSKFDCTFFPVKSSEKVYPLTGA